MICNNLDYHPQSNQICKQLRLLLVDRDRSFTVSETYIMTNLRRIFLRGSIICCREMPRTSQFQACFTAPEPASFRPSSQPQNWPVPGLLHSPRTGQFQAHFTAPELANSRPTSSPRTKPVSGLLHSPRTSQFQACFTAPEPASSRPVSQPQNQPVSDLPHSPRTGQF